MTSLLGLLSLKGLPNLGPRVRTPPPLEDYRCWVLDPSMDRFFFTLSGCRELFLKWGTCLPSLGRSRCYCSGGCGGRISSFFQDFFMRTFHERVLELSSGFDPRFASRPPPRVQDCSAALPAPLRPRSDRIMPPLRYPNPSPAQHIRRRVGSLKPFPFQDRDQKTCAQWRVSVVVCRRFVFGVELSV